MSEEDGQGVPQRARELAHDVLAWLFALGFLVGVPAWAIWSNWGKPLYTTETVTVTKTVHTGFLIDAGNVLVPWFVLVFVFFLLASGVMPRPY